MHNDNIEAAWNHFNCSSHCLAVNKTCWKTVNGSNSTSRHQSVHFNIYCRAWILTTLFLFVHFIEEHKTQKTENQNAWSWHHNKATIVLITIIIVRSMKHTKMQNSFFQCIECRCQHLLLLLLLWTTIQSDYNSRNVYSTKQLVITSSHTTPFQFWYMFFDEEVKKRNVSRESWKERKCLRS